MSAWSPRQQRAQQRGEVAPLAGGEVGEDLALGRHVGVHDLVDEVEPRRREAHDHLAAVVGRGPLDEAALLEAVDAVRDGTGGDHRLADEVAGRQLVGLARAAQRGEDVVHPVLDAEAGEVLGEAPVDEPGQPRDPPDDADRRDVEVGAHRVPLADDAIDGVACRLAARRRSYADDRLTFIILILR